MATTTYTDPSPAGVTTAALDSSAHIHRRISWAAVFGGVILVVVLQILFSLLGAGVGLGTVNTNAGSTPTAGTLGITAGLWWVLSSCIAIGVGGFVAAWFAGVEIRFDGVLHGLVTWGIATLLTFWLLTSAIGSVVGGGLFCPRQCGVRFRQWPKRNGETACSGRRRFSRYDPATGAGLSSAYQS
jgi:hypothetical protein